MAIKAPVFIRDATGLVRSLSGFDLFNLAYGQIMPAVGIVFIVSFSPFAFPQSNMFLAFLIVMPLVALGPALIYSMLAAAMPRSGGDYVYVSRIIHPALGFMTNWLFTCVVYSFIATAGFVFSSTAFNVFLATIGTMTNSPWLVNDSTWFTTNTGELVTGTVLIAGIMVLLVYRTAVWKFMKILFVIVMVGTIVNIFYLMSVSQSAFVAAFNSQFASSGFTYNGIIQTATKNGYLQGWTWTGTVGALIYAMGGLVGFNFSAYSAGEAKNASKSMPLSIIGSTIIGGILFALWAFGIYNAFGYDFFSAANYLVNCCSSTVTLPFTASVNALFTYLPNQNPVVELLGALGFGLAWIWLTPTDFIPVVRNMFAWAFDRVGPSWLADVNDTYHTPVKSIVLSAALGEILLVLAIYTTGISLVFANGAILINLAFLLTSIAGVFFPYRAKKIFEQSPAWVRRKVGGIPLVSIVGLFSTIVELILLYGGITNAVIGGAPGSYPFAVGIAVSGIILYYVAKAYRKRQGVDLTLVFNDIPPE
jgi:amino acid transporter